MDDDRTKVLIAEYADDKLVYRENCKERHQNMIMYLRLIWGTLVSIILLLVKVAFFT